MRVINKTGWRTSDLKRILTECAIREELSPDLRKELVVHIVHARSRPYRGRASIGGSWSRLWVPSVKLGRFDSVSFAHIARHEFAHNRGYREERAMRATKEYGWVDGWREVDAWVSSYPVRQKDPPKSWSRPGDSEKLVRLFEQQTTWQRKAKLAATKLRKLKLRIKYYERKVAAMSPVGGSV